MRKLAINGATDAGGRGLVRPHRAARILVVDDESHVRSMMGAMLERQGYEVQTGVFGADMQVALVNDGPVTLLLEA